MKLLPLFFCGLLALISGSRSRADEFIIDQNNEFDPAIGPTLASLVAPGIMQGTSFTPTTNALDFVDLLNNPQDSSATLQVLICLDPEVVGASELLQFTNTTLTTNRFRFYPSVALQPGKTYTLRIQTLDRWTTVLGNPNLFFREGTIVPAPVPPPLSIHFSSVDVCWSSRAGTNYQVQYRSAGTTNIWTDLGPPALGNGVTNCVTDPIAGPQKFYRVKIVP